MQLARFAGVGGFGWILASLAAACVSAEPYIKFGGATDANGWGKVHVELYHSDTERYGPYGSTTSLLTGEPMEHNHLILDTGANAILFVAESAGDLETTQLTHGYHTEAQFEELGVAGLAYLNVSRAYGFDVIDSDGVRHSLPRNDDHVRVLSDSQENLGLYNLANSLIPAPGIAGMPAMINRVTTFDPSAWIDTPDLFALPDLRVVLRDEVPPADGHRYTVPLNNDLRFQAEEGRPNFELPGSPLPTWADVPFLTAKCHYDQTWMEANFLLDTGAGAPILSERMAMQLGLDSNGDGVLGRGPGGEDDGYAGDAEVGGLGGSVVVPIMSLNSLALPTQEGVDLRWTDPDWGIQVVIVSGLPEEIDGAMSIDLLTSGIKADYENWGDLSDPLPPLGEPYFRKIHLDFRDPDTGPYGTMYLDVSPPRHQIIPEPSTVLMLIVAAAGTFISRKRRHI